MVKTELDDTMLEVMRQDEVKKQRLTVRLELIDGSKRKGIYLDLTEDPMKRYEYKDTPFIKLISNRPEKDTTIYLPINSIKSIEWAA